VMPDAEGDGTGGPEQEALGLEAVDTEDAP
jgi:hypothetical protein